MDTWPGSRSLVGWMIAWWLMRCHKTTITTPTPELGNYPSIIVNDEVMMVGDGGSVAADAATHPESFNHQWWGNDVTHKTTIMIQSMSEQAAMGGDMGLKSNVVLLLTATVLNIFTHATISHFVDIVNTQLRAERGWCIILTIDTASDDSSLAHSN